MKRKSFDELYNIHVGLCLTLGIDALHRTDEESFEQQLRVLVGLGLIALQNKDGAIRGRVLCCYIAACMTLAIFLKNKGLLFSDLLESEEFPFVLGEERRGEKPEENGFHLN